MNHPPRQLRQHCYHPAPRRRRRFPHPALADLRRCSCHMPSRIRSTAPLLAKLVSFVTPPSVGEQLVDQHPKTRQHVR